ncbi:MAG TPA: endonuclease Q family protein [Candidatus Levybacteria bacterium]|nr:endonuclease Q family protein [Candidatus Levybacteria bacterium]
MNTLVVDLHLHSRFSRAVSSSITIHNLYLWGKMKGIHVLSVSDVTHPIWLQEIEVQLIEQQDGVYTLKETEKMSEFIQNDHTRNVIDPCFILTTELSLIYSEFGKGRRVHVIVCFPDLAVVKKANKIFVNHGFNLTSDGRPILGISLRNLCELLLSVDPRIVIIPAHAWTPWFGVYGSKSGYDSLSDAFGEYETHIFAIESGLSSDPRMNWQIEELTHRSIVSFSDAHSLSKIGREATVLKYKRKEERMKREDLTYKNIINGLKKGGDSPFELAYTIEYYPEEGKYHYTGHRVCGVALSPEQTHVQGTVCPVCGRELTVGVLHQIENLKKQTTISVTNHTDTHGVVWQKGSTGEKFVNLVPLLEIIAETVEVGVNSKKVKTLYSQMITALGPELYILLESSLESITRIAGERIAQAIDKVRRRDIVIQPGFDGEYGKVRIWEEDTSVEQLKMI